MSGSRGYATNLNDFISVRKRSAQLAFEAAIDAAFTRLGKNLHPTFVMGDDNSRNFGVRVFWDLDTTKLPAGYNVENLKDKILSAIQKHNDSYFVLEDVICYGNVRVFSPKDYSTLTSKGFKLLHVQRRRNKCSYCKEIIESKNPEDQFDKFLRKMDLADALVVQSMCLYALDVESPANMLVITGDEDFATPIASLKTRGFNMFVAVDGDAKNPLLQNSGNRWWWWSQLLVGGGPI